MINDIAEQAILAAITPLLPPGLTIYVSDETENKKFVAPCLIIHAMPSEEVITPGSGIYKVEVQAKLRSHNLEDAREFRTQCVTILDMWAHSSPSPAAGLSTFPNFHCHGFQPLRGELGVDTDQKTLDYTTSWQLWCMPRSDT